MFPTPTHTSQIPFLNMFAISVMPKAFRACLLLTYILTPFSSLQGEIREPDGDGDEVFAADEG